jgi:molecular chaperone GrpE
MSGYPGEAGQPEHPGQHGQHGQPGQQDEEDGAQHQGPVIRDKRRIDPETGELRQPAQPAATDPTIPDDLSGLDELTRLAEGERGGDAALAAERLADLQRLQAEYVNYRKRVERDRDVARDQAVGGVLEALLPVLDDIHLARQHGDLDGGPFAAIADKLDAVLNRYGLQRFGEAGEPFDPAVHEALMHTQADLGEGVDVTTVTQVLQPGYRQGDRVLRAARVAVADPE